MCYIPFREELWSADLGRYQTFGICAYAKIEGGWREVIRLSDVSVDLAFVTALCERCNRGQLSPLHLRDVVEDAL